MTMKNVQNYFLALLLVTLITACSSDNSDDKDLEKPTITINYSDGFPQACEVLTKGETYNFKALVTDNLELASYSIDIHNNFDHHTHDDQEGDCDLDAIKEADNPFIFMQNYTLEAGLTSYEIDHNIAIPSDIDTGDYHCSFSITDATGWQSITSIDIKIVE